MQRQSRISRVVAVGMCASGWLLLLFGLLPMEGRGQGFLVSESQELAFGMPRPPIGIPPFPMPPHPIPPRPTPPPPPSLTYKVKQLSVNGSINEQVARLQITQSFVNTGSVPIEASFVFPLPHEGAVDQLTLLVDGKEYSGKLLDAAEARRIYESYVRRNRDPALLEWMGLGMFKTSVFPIPPGAERTVTLRFTQVCRQNAGVTELLFPWSAAKYTTQPIEKLSARISLETRVPLKNIYSPSHPVNIERPDDRHAVVSFSAANDVPRSDFQLLFDVGREAVGASVLSYRPRGDDDGFFLMLVTPEVKSVMAEQLRKNVVFVVDRSGSMSGPKIEQAKAALKFVLNNLREGDLFNVVAYDTEVESFRPELQRFQDDTRKAALGFVESIHAGGSTNIDGALRVAFSQLVDRSRPNYLLFLTDGLPTAGETQEAKIVQRAAEANQVRARLFTFGVGYDVNSRLLDKLARGGYGQSEYVRPNEDIETHVGRLYGRIGAPTLTDVKLEVVMPGAAVEQGPVVNRVYPKQIYDLFAGDQLVLVGRYRSAGEGKLRITGLVGEEKREFEFPASLVARSPEGAPAFIEKLWAVRRVGEIIDQIDLNGSNQELIDELVALSKRHGILTPYTSFLADDQPQARDVAGARREASERLRALSNESGVSGFAQRSNKAQLQGALTAPAAGGGQFAAADEDRVVTVRTVQNVGRKTFYWRGDRWVDSAASDTQVEKARKVERFSDEYFELARRLGRSVSPYLAMEGRIVLLIENEAIQLE
ncbi:MAG: VIT and VWA domain-containing protein [Pirellulales bacterium]